MPVIGQFQISDIARVSYILHERWGRIVRLGGLLGRPDLLFVYDADEIEKVCNSSLKKIIIFPKSSVMSIVRTIKVFFFIIQTLNTRFQFTSP